MQLLLEKDGLFFSLNRLKTSAGVRTEGKNRNGRCRDGVSRRANREPSEASPRRCAPPPFHQGGLTGSLQKAGAFHRLRGILYFTDGLGLYPSKRPPYDAAFVMLAGQGYPERVPPWGIRVVLDPDTLETGGNP